MWVITSLPGFAALATRPMSSGWEDVLEDVAAEGEEGARSGLTYARVPALKSELARAVLAALRLD
jgi:hypothetical protein